MSLEITQSPPGMSESPTNDISIVEQDAQPYVAVTGHVTMQTFSELADRLPGVFGWLDAHGTAPAGPPFFRYRVIDMANEMVIEAGVPMAGPVAPEGDLTVDELPSGRYVTRTYIGPPEDLVEVTAGLLRWAEDRGLVFEARPSEAGEVWGCRLEWLEYNPAEQPDRRTWQTRLAFRLAD
jgi:effector-binding domain-containing protein